MEIINDSAEFKEMIMLWQHIYIMSSIYSAYAVCPLLEENKYSLDLERYHDNILRFRDRFEFLANELKRKYDYSLSDIKIAASDMVRFLAEEYDRQMTEWIKIYNTVYPDHDEAR